MPPETPQADAADVVAKLRKRTIVIPDAPFFSTTVPDPDCSDAADAIERLSAELRREVSDRQNIELLYERGKAELQAAKEALAWYGEQARLCRLIHSGGDAGRAALDADGGKRAQAVLSASPSPDTENGK